MTTFKQELENLLTNYYVNSHSVTTMHELSIDEKLNKQREVDDEATQAIIELVDREKAQAVMNFVAQYKAERINHTLSTKTNEWKRELDHLGEFHTRFQKSIKAKLGLDK